MATRNLFGGLESQLLQAQAAGSLDCHQVVEPRIKAYAGGLIRQFPLMARFKADMAQEGLLIFWRDLRRFLWICPVCDFQTKDPEEYSAHCQETHKKEIVPKSDLGMFLSSRVKSYMRNFIWSEFAQKRDLRRTVLTGVDSDVERPDERTPEDQAATREAIERVRGLVEEELDARVREAVLACLEGLEGADVYRRMVNSGLYASIDSARVCLRKLQAAGAFNSYASVLCPSV